MKFFNFFYFCGSFLPSWIRIHWPDWIRIQLGSGSGSVTLVKILAKFKKILYFRKQLSQKQSQKLKIKIFSEGPAGWGDSAGEPEGAGADQPGREARDAGDHPQRQGQDLQDHGGGDCQPQGTAWSPGDIRNPPPKEKNIWSMVHEMRTKKNGAWDRQQWCIRWQKMVLEMKTMVLEMKTMVLEIETMVLEIKH